MSYSLFWDRMGPRCSSNEGSAATAENSLRVSILGEKPITKRAKVRGN